MIPRSWLDFSDKIVRENKDLEPISITWDRIFGTSDISDVLELRCHVIGTNRLYSKESEHVLDETSDISDVLNVGKVYQLFRDML